MKILVIDAQGGGLGRQIVTRIKEVHPEYSVTAVGTNTEATNAMRKAGADIAATGENAVIVNSRNVDVICGPIGIVIADSLYGEITPEMAKAVAQSSATRLLIPINRCENIIIGVEKPNLSVMVDHLVNRITELDK